MKRIRQTLRAVLIPSLAGIVMAQMISCDAGSPDCSGPGDQLFDKSTDILVESGGRPPEKRATITFGDQTLTLFPYTSVRFDGSPVDPVNLVFVGLADPVRIRAALCALDGDRSAFGFPSVPPFDLRWTDAVGGDIHTAYAWNGDGWVGSVIQLTLGDYGPLRVHLRMFRTGCILGTGCWTLGGAHFELQIPGTTEHQVLSWEIAEQLVVADMMRSGLLDPDLPVMSTGPINARPWYRTIPPEIYNELPLELIDMIGGPPPPVVQPVPLFSDGEGSIINVAHLAPMATATHTAGSTVQFDQLVPRPFCAIGPGDLLRISGPVDFTLTVSVDEAGHYCSHADYCGEFVAQPYEYLDGAVVPVGDPFTGLVEGTQQVSICPTSARVLMLDLRLTHEKGGPQLTATSLEVPQRGLKLYRNQLQCIDR